MSHIPNSAMPHAIPSQNDQEEGRRGLAQKARANPKMAVAAGAVVAGVVAAAAIPAVRAARKRSSDRNESNEPASEA